MTTVLRVALTTYNYQMLLTCKAHLCFPQAVVVNAFSNSRLQELLWSQGFISLGVIPKSGYLYTKGWTDSYIMYKETTRSGSQVDNSLQLSCQDMKTIALSNQEAQKRPSEAVNMAQVCQ